MTPDIIFVSILGLGIIVSLFMAIFTKKLYRMLIYFLIANMFLSALLAMFGMTILAALILLTNAGVVAIMVFLSMIVGEVVEE